MSMTKMLGVAAALAMMGGLAACDKSKPELDSTRRQLQNVTMERDSLKGQLEDSRRRAAVLQQQVAEIQAKLSAAAAALVGLLTKLRTEKKIGDNIAMVSVADGFGIDLSKAARAGFEKAKFKLVYDKSYPIGTQDMSPVVGEAQRSGADVFVAFSYPPDTIALTEQSRLSSYAPKVMFLGVGVGFPLYPGRFKENTEGIMSLGGWSADNAAITDYRKKHNDMHKRDPDYWGSQVGYASLQALEQAIERVGKIDRAAIIKELQNGTFDTVLGKIKFTDNTLTNAFWLIGQWQGGFYTGVAPDRAGAKPVVVPKPAWKAQ